MLPARHPGVPAARRGTAAVMTEPTDAPQPADASPPDAGQPDAFQPAAGPADAQPTHDAQPAKDAREPADSPQRRLVQTVAAYEVDPPAPARVREEPSGT